MNPEVWLPAGARWKPSRKVPFVAVVAVEDAEAIAQMQLAKLVVYTPHTAVMVEPTSHKPMAILGWAPTK